MKERNFMFTVYQFDPGNCGMIFTEKELLHNAPPDRFTLETLIASDKFIEEAYRQLQLRLAMEEESEEQNG